ncbi:MAG TPA: IS110 family transposase [Longimicrobium sp.]|nr:IS110 family transposase [Longimicrobium sp.]
MFTAGIDAHTRYVVVVIVNKSGELVLGPVRIRASEPERLLETLAPYRPLEAVVETSSSWPWLYELLTPAGVGFVLAHAKKLRAIAEANYKSDDIDAELLARMRLAGCIPEVYPTPATQREWATLVRHRQRLAAQRTTLINRIHGQLHQIGLHTGRGELLTRAGRTWLRTSAWPKLSKEQRRLIRSHLHLIGEIQPLVRALDRRIAQVAATIPEAGLLQTIPGIGAYRALVLCAEALPIRRFVHPANLVSYAGLAPRSKRSGQRPVRYGEIPRGANRWLRGTLVRAVVSHVQSAPESWLSQFYAEKKPTLGWPTARIAAARRLTRAIHAMLRTNTSWKDVPPSRGELPEPHAVSTA